MVGVTPPPDGFDDPGGRIYTSTEPASTAAFAIRILKSPELGAVVSSVSSIGVRLAA
jgi:hypothetical protein